ncbi:MAG TPA: hypothetical protein VFB72_05070 [Verrucomicrobiae bacterium]|nr:hypothetical protein [Verrucomicrobiae bacterium]
MKWFFIIANVLAAIALFFMGSFAVAAHRTHAYSVYRELQTQHVLAERPDYDVEKRLRTMADGGMYSLWIAEIGGGLLLVNALSAFVLFRK